VGCQKGCKNVTSNDVRGCSKGLRGGEYKLPSLGGVGGKGICELVLHGHPRQNRLGGKEFGARHTQTIRFRSERGLAVGVVGGT